MKILRIALVALSMQGIALTAKDTSENLAPVREQSLSELRAEQAKKLTNIRAAKASLEQELREDWKKEIERRNILRPPTIGDSLVFWFATDAVWGAALGIARGLFEKHKNLSIGLGVLGAVSAYYSLQKQYVLGESSKDTCNCHTSCQGCDCSGLENAVLGTLTAIIVGGITNKIVFGRSASGGGQ